MSGLTFAVLWSGKVNLRDTSSFLDVSKSGRPAALIFLIYMYLKHLNLYNSQAMRIIKIIP